VALALRVDSKTIPPWVLKVISDGERCESYFCTSRVIHESVQELLDSKPEDELKLLASTIARRRSIVTYWPTTTGAVRLSVDRSD
jgi:hypothetical protein